MTRWKFRTPNWTCTNGSLPAPIMTTPPSPGSWAGAERWQDPGIADQTRMSTPVTNCLSLPVFYSNRENGRDGHYLSLWAPG